MAMCRLCGFDCSGIGRHHQEVLVIFQVVAGHEVLVQGMHVPVGRNGLGKVV